MLRLKKPIVQRAGWFANSDLKPVFFAASPTILSQAATG